jgi:hypothetical protein
MDKPVGNADLHSLQAWFFRGYLKLEGEFYESKNMGSLSGNGRIT